MTNQPRDFAPKFIRKSLLSIPRHEKEPRLLITKGQRKINNDPSFPNPKQKFIIPILLQFFQTIKVNEFVQPNHIPISDDHPDLHIADQYPPRVWHTLSKSDVEMIQKFHDKRVDRKPKAILESCLVKVYFPKREVASPFPFMRQTNPDLLRKLEPVFKPKKSVNVQRTLFTKGVKCPDLPPTRGRGVNLCLNKVVARRQPSFQLVP